MSLRAMTWALEQAPVDDPTEALLLVALADRAGDDGRGAWPSQQWLADRTRVTTRSVRRMLAGLEARGLIVRGDSRIVDHLPADRRPVVWNLTLAMVRPDLDGRTPTTGRGRPAGSERPVVDDRPDTDDRSWVTERPDAHDRTTGRGRPTNRPEPSKNLEARKRATTAPDTFDIDDALRDWAREKKIIADLDGETERFLDHHRAKGNTFKDWRAAWRTWMSRSRDYAPTGARPEHDWNGIPPWERFTDNDGEIPPWEDFR